MDFSETYRFSGPQPSCSADGKYIAAATEYRLVVRDCLSTQVVQIFSCIDKISHIEWCPNSTYILCGLVKRAIVQVWSVGEPDWTCKIDEGLAGAEAVRWSPDGLHILVTADFQIRYALLRLWQQSHPLKQTFKHHCRITIWSLTTKSFVYISGPKHAAKGLKFSPDGKYMAVAEVLMGAHGNHVPTLHTYLHLITCVCCCRERSAKMSSACTPAVTGHW